MPAERVSAVDGSVHESWSAEEEWAAHLAEERERVYIEMEAFCGHERAEAWLRRQEAIDAGEAIEDVPGQEMMWGEGEEPGEQAERPTGSPCGYHRGQSDIGSVDSVAVGLDWITMVGTNRMRDAVLEWAERRWGTTTTQLGLRWYHDAKAWAAGPTIGWDHRGGADSIIVELRGQVLALMEPEERIDLLRELDELGLVASRLDCAEDIKGEGLRMVEETIEACKRGELVGAKVWNPDVHYRGVEVCGIGIAIGKRGKEGSGRQQTRYDKGLQMGEDRGNWQRIESRYYGKCAQQVCGDLLKARAWEDVMHRHILGTVEFREANGQRHRRRRPMAEWWAGYVDGAETLMAKAERIASTLAGRLRWYAQAVLPGLIGLAEAADRGLRDVVEDVLLGVSCSEEAIERAAASATAAEYRVMWQHRKHRTLFCSQLRT